MRPILIDLDGVLADFVYGFSLTANDAFGTPLINTMECPQRDIIDALGLMKPQGREVWRLIEKSDVFWTDLPVLASASTFNRITKYKNIIFCTLRHSWAQEQTRKWLDSHGLWQPCLHVQDKAPFAVIFKNGGLMLDDYAPIVFNTNSLAVKAGSKFRSWLLPRPYSAQYQGLPCVSTVDEFLDICDKEA